MQNGPAPRPGETEAEGDSEHRFLTVAAEMKYVHGVFIGFGGLLGAFAFVWEERGPLRPGSTPIGYSTCCLPLLPPTDTPMNRVGGGSPALHARKRERESKRASEGVRGGAKRFVILELVINHHTPPRVQYRHAPCAMCSC